MNDSPAQPEGFEESAAVVVSEKSRKLSRFRVPSHGGGILKRGGANKGAGRPRSVVRDACMGLFEERLPVLQEIADGGHTVVDVKGLAKALGPALRKLKINLPVEKRAKIAEALAPQLGRLVWPEIKPGERIKAMDVLAKYGVGTLKEHNVKQVQRMEIVLVDEGPTAQGPGGTS